MIGLTVGSNFGAATQQHEVDIQMTVNCFKSQVAETAGLDVKGISLYCGARYMVGSKTLLDNEVQDGAVLTMKQYTSRDDRAKERVIRLGGYARSTKHDIRSAKNAVIGANLQEHKDTRSLIAPLAADVTAVKDLLLGTERPKTPGRSDKERLKELRIQKRCMDNEISDLRERESTRLSETKRAAANHLLTVAEVADGAVQLAVGDVSTREEVAIATGKLTENYKAQKATLAALDKQYRKKDTPKRKNVAKSAPKKARRSTHPEASGSTHLEEPDAASGHWL